jgi:hypothetical protein
MAMATDDAKGPAALRLVESMIHTVRGQKVILDRDLAAVYRVPTFRFNEAVKRNREMFPADFAFQLEPQEVVDLISQNAISRSGHGGLRKLPWVFTEHGAVMAANILRSDRAIQMSVFVVRAFIRMRAVLMGNAELARKLVSLEREVKARLDTHDAAIVDVLSRIMDIIDPPALPEPPPKQIGYGVRERRAAYTTRGNRR